MFESNHFCGKHFHCFFEPNKLVIYLILYKAIQDFFLSESQRKNSQIVAYKKQDNPIDFFVPYPKAIATILFGCYRVEYRQSN